MVVGILSADISYLKILKLKCIFNLIFFNLILKIYKIF